MNMTEREARIAFNMIPTVGAITLNRLMRENGGSAAWAYEVFPEKLDWEGKVPDWEGEIARAQKMNVRIITAEDAEYPRQLLNIASPPLALYVVGNVAALSKAGVALVGTRGASSYGRETAERFACGLAARGWVVFSGLARGIDAAAHRGALAGGGVTVGVLGGALDQFYPQENRDLARQMVEKGGCVVSEFPFGRSPDVQTFPQRNRIVSGLSLGVVAVECPMHSGTMITCNRALEQGRAVMAVPGRIDWKNAEGCLAMIRDGARMVTSVDDIVEEVTPIGRKLGERSQARSVESIQNATTSRPSDATAAAAVGRRPQPVKEVLPEQRFSVEEALVLREVPESGTTIDALARATGIDMAKLNPLLVGLRLKGRLKFLPGSRVALHH